MYTSKTMNASEMIGLIETACAGAVVAKQADGLHPWVSVKPERWRDVAMFVRDDARLKLDMLRSITGLDYPDKKQLAAAYDLISFDHRHELCIKVFVDRPALPARPVIASVAEVWRAADWHERETYDLLGIVFEGHPDSVTDQDGTHPRRILLPDDWTGHPLRKDYVFPREYGGIPGSVEIDWAQKPDYPK